MDDGSNDGAGGFGDDGSGNAGNDGQGGGRPMECKTGADCSDGDKCTVDYCFDGTCSNKKGECCSDADCATDHVCGQSHLRCRKAQVCLGAGGDGGAVIPVVSTGGKYEFAGVPFVPGQAVGLRRGVYTMEVPKLHAIRLADDAPDVLSMSGLNLLRVWTECSLVAWLPEPSSSKDGVQSGSVVPIVMWPRKQWRAFPLVCRHPLPNVIAHLRGADDPSTTSRTVSFLLFGTFCEALS